MRYILKQISKKYGFCYKKIEIQSKQNTKITCKIQEPNIFIKLRLVEEGYSIKQKIQLNLVDQQPSKSCLHALNYNNIIVLQSKVSYCDGKFLLIKFLPSNYCIWNAPMTPYQYYILSPSMTFQNLVFQEAPTTPSEQNQIQRNKLSGAQNTIQFSLGPSKIQSIPTQLPIQYQKAVSSSILQNSRKMKKNMTNHNVLPNIINTLLSYIRRRNKTGKLIEKILHKFKVNSLNFNSNKYFAYQIYLHSKIPKSKHQNSLRYILNHVDPNLAIFSIQEQIFYNQICRILISQLLNQEFMLTFLTTRKCSKTSKSDHLKAKRFIKAILVERVEHINSLSIS